MLLLYCVAFCNAQNNGTSKENINISNFSVKSITDEKISVTVDYFYEGPIRLKEHYIYAFIKDEKGTSLSRDLRSKGIPLKTGTNRVSFTIEKKSQRDNFTSTSIEICMLAIKLKILCREFSYTKTWKSSLEPVQIVSFESNKAKVARGESIKLTWETLNAGQVVIRRGGTNELKEVEASGSMQVSVDKTTTFYLMTSRPNPKGPSVVEAKNIKITVVNKEPIIGNFHASFTTIRRGIKSKLFWNTYGAEYVSLNGESVKLNGDKVVSPIKTTRYTIKVQAGNNISEEHVVIYVTPFAAPNVSFPFYSLELCKDVDTNNGFTRCISSDGPFNTGDKIYLIARFKNLPIGKHSLKRTTYNGVFGTNKWTKVHQEESSFENTKTEGVITFLVANLGEGTKKLKLNLNNQNISSEIVYCIDCPRMWD